MPESRLQEDLDALAQIGRTGDGVTRVAWSADLVAANEWLAARMRDAGLDPEIDPAGNVVGRWEAPQGKAIVVGSHIDTVPNGGRYDGALGVVAALHVLLALQDVDLPFALEAIDFTDEEGTLVGLLGSE